MLQQARLQPGLLLRGGERGGIAFMFPDRVEQAFRRFQQPLHRGRTLLLHQVIGVEPRGRVTKPSEWPGRSRGSARVVARRRPAARPRPRRSTARRFHHAPEQLDLPFGQRGAERSDRILDPRRRQRDHVHVAFDHDQPVRLARSRAGAVEIVKRAALVEQRRVGRVEIFRRVVLPESRIRPPNAITRPRTSRIGSIRRPRKRS